MDLITKTHAHVKHFTVTGYVTNKERTKLLMVHHKKLGKWLPAGGHLEPNELPHEAAIREVKEETGVQARLFPATTNTPDLNLKSITDTQIPAPYALTYQLIPKTTKEDEHIHIDMLYYLEAEESKTQAALSEVHAATWQSKQVILHTLDTFDAVRSFAELELHD